MHEPTEVTLELRPWLQGAYTLLSLRGPVETVPDPKEVRSLLRMLSRLSGAPVDVALHVDGTNSGACWLEVWNDALAKVRGRHLYQARLVVHRHREVTKTAGGSDDE
jgi:hypothetical protein